MRHALGKWDWISQKSTPFPIQPCATRGIDLCDAKSAQKRQQYHLMFVKQLEKVAGHMGHNCKLRIRNPLKRSNTPQSCLHHHHHGHQDLLYIFTKGDGEKLVCPTKEKQFSAEGWNCIWDNSEEKRVAIRKFSWKIGEIDQRGFLPPVDRAINVIVIVIKGRVRAAIGDARWLSIVSRSFRKIDRGPANHPSFFWEIHGKTCEKVLNDSEFGWEHFLKMIRA